MYCKQCGVELPGDSKFCYKCGDMTVDGDVKAAQPQVAADKAGRNRRAHIAMSVCGIALLGISATAICMALRSSSVPTDISASTPISSSPLVSSEIAASDSASTIINENGITYPNGDKYVGEIADGKPNGAGQLFYADGSVFAGVYANGLREGKGEEHFADGSVADGMYSGDLLNGAGSIHYANGEIYIGEFKDGKKHGQGTYYYKDGTRFEGRFEHDAPVE